jgi:hypothetical protein
MKHVKLAVLMMLVALSGLATAQMIGSTRIATKVPFEFVASNKIVPAGEYLVQAATADRKTLMLSNVVAHLGVFLPALSTESKVDATHYALVFTRYGDQYFLSGIKLQGSKIGYRLPESKAEVELRAKNVPAAEETLLAYKK